MARNRGTKNEGGRKMKIRTFTISVAIILSMTSLSLVSIQLATAAGGSSKPSDGSILPFPMPPMGGKVGPTMQESVHKWRQQPRHLPKDAPNILIVMLDDCHVG